MTRILIAHDHALIREGIRNILLHLTDFEVAGEAADAAGTIALVRSTQAHVLILDASIAGHTGVELIREIGEINQGIQVLVLTMNGDEQYAMRAFEAGASGYLTRESASGELIGALMTIASGGLYMGVAMAGQIGRNPPEPVEALPHRRLSKREFDVFRRITAGERIGEIATQLCVSTKTVSTYKARILEKMRMPHGTALVRYAMRHRLFDDSEEP
ncbi:response regulator [Paraburkholderia diazotrophica]|uniref:DNA-binding response regulator, NarL/FixJ family, contains REC and HTH domains n=1 Tax=Paraburkholderia diazotrophica TaxID=667676 RepID=A0A1H6QHC9_9BURK|nr:response regulator transcription factor [Paraburkholderia diazotrophica]SEI38392.1 DNA-binding response regulator, NarL/FixJ family, contains REC and HTH domains [Paraburkholderia diazotrophica]